MGLVLVQNKRCNRWTRTTPYNTAHTSAPTPDHCAPPPDGGASLSSATQH
jgi:hypothetical protein